MPVTYNLMIVSTFVASVAKRPKPHAPTTTISFGPDATLGTEATNL